MLRNGAKQFQSIGWLPIAMGLYVWGFIFPCDLLGTTGEVFVTWDGVARVMDELRRANWEALAQLEGETKAWLKWGARMLTRC